MKHAVSLAVLASLLSAPSAFAQEGDEIIVTATKRAESSNDIAASLEIVSADELSNLISAEDITQSLSGVQAAISNGSQVTFQIRGIGAVDHQALTPGAAAVHLDGVFLATNVQASPLLFDLARVEVLKGPQGTLYGRNASAGAINFITAAPGAGSFIQIDAGENELLSLGGAADYTVSDDLIVRASGRYLTEGPLLDNVVTQPGIDAPSDGGGERDEFGLRLQGLYTGFQDTRLLVKAKYAEDNGINPAPRNDAQDLDDHQISIGPDGIQKSDSEFYGASAELTRDLDGIDLYNLTAFEGFNQNYGFDFDAAPAPFATPSLNANLAYDRDMSQWSNETRLSWEAGASEFMAGLYLETSSFDQDYLIWCGELDTDTLLGTCRYVGAPGRAGPNPASPGTATSLLSIISQDRQTAALFTYNNISLNERLDLIAGARLSYENIEGEGRGLHYFDDGTVALNNRDGLGLAEGSNTLTDTRLSGNLALEYRPREGQLIYLGWSNGYKSGGFNGEVINNALHFADEGLFGPEMVNAIEGGVKMSGERGYLNLAAFYQFYDSPQARIFVPFNLAGGGSFTSNSLSNLDEATSYGLEADFGWQASEQWELGGSLTLMDTRIHQAEDPAVPQNADVFDGNPLPFASNVTGHVFTSYHQPLTDNLSADLRLDLTHKGAFYLDAEGLQSRRASEYTLIDSTIRLNIGDSTQLSLWGRNLLDEDYAVSGYGFIGYNTFRSAPRRFGVSVRQEF